MTKNLCLREFWCCCYCFDRYDVSTTVVFRALLLEVGVEIIVSIVVDGVVVEVS